MFDRTEEARKKCREQLDELETMVKQLKELQATPDFPPRIRQELLKNPALFGSYVTFFEDARKEIVSAASFSELDMLKNNYWAMAIKYKNLNKTAEEEPARLQAESMRQKEEAANYKPLPDNEVLGYLDKLSKLNPQMLQEQLKNNEITSDTKMKPLIETLIKKCQSDIAVVGVLNIGSITSEKLMEMRNTDLSRIKAIEKNCVEFNKVFKQLNDKIEMKKVSLGSDIKHYKAEEKTKKELVTRLDGDIGKIEELKAENNKNNKNDLSKKRSELIDKKKLPAIDRAITDVAAKKIRLESTLADMKSTTHTGLKRFFSPKKSQEYTNQKREISRCYDCKRALESTKISLGFDKTLDETKGDKAFEDISSNNAYKSILPVSTKAEFESCKQTLLKFENDQKAIAAPQGVKVEELRKAKNTTSAEAANLTTKISEMESSLKTFTTFSNKLNHQAAGQSQYQQSNNDASPSMTLRSS
jgi:hypothetical protein